MSTLSPGVSSPTALQEPGSDWYRDCLTRLGCVFGLSQPLDALFRPRPCRSCFVPAALLGFPLQRFVPSRRRDASRLPRPSWRCCRRPHEAVVRVRFGLRVTVAVVPLRGAGEPSREDAAEAGRAFRGLELVLEVRTPVSGGWPLDGADPLLGFHGLQGVPPSRLRATNVAQSSRALC